MKNLIRISVIILLILGAGIIFSSRLFHLVSTADLPKDVPIINGKIVSISTFRSDELKRGISIVVETSASLPEVANYYTEEFAKRDIRAFGMPAFQGDSRDLETSTEAFGAGETESNDQVTVNIQSKTSFTLVEINVLGNSMLSLPQ